MAVEKKFIREAVGRLLIREYLHKETERAGFGGIDIQRTPMGTRVSIVAERPGMVIGRKGSTINALTENLNRRFAVENPQIEVIEAGQEANVNAQIMAQKLAEALERGWHFRRAGHSTVQRVMQSGAQGCQVIIAGKLTGQRHRTEKFSQGHIKYCGETADRVMDVGFAVCKKKLGVIGCTVRVMRSHWKLPDNITIEKKGPTAVVVETPPPAAEAAAAPEPAAEAPKKRAPKKKEAPAEPETTEAAAEKPAKAAKAPKPKKAPKAEPAAEPEATEAKTEAVKDTEAEA
jgi:small subunit ribosomal protein S3